MPHQLTFTTCLALLCLPLGLSSAKAVEISGVSIADVSSQYGPASGPSGATHTINGNGLSTEPIITDRTHSNGYPQGGGSGFFWLTVASPAADAFITFDLGNTYNVDTLHIWNFNAAYSGGDESDRGFRQFDISAGSTLGSLNEIVSDALLTQAVNPSRAPFSTGVQTFDLSGLANDVRYIRLDADSNFGSLYTGLSEVRFEWGNVICSAPLPFGLDSGPCNPLPEVVLQLDALAGNTRTGLNLPAAGAIEILNHPGAPGGLLSVWMNVLGIDITSAIDEINHLGSDDVVAEAADGNPYDDVPANILLTFPGGVADTNTGLSHGVTFRYDFGDGASIDTVTVPEPSSMLLFGLGLLGLAGVRRRRIG